MELTTIEILIRLALALALGGLVGVERSLAGKNAGMRTYALASMGASLFVIISQLASAKLIGTVAFNPIALAPAVISGIGFIGAGLVFHNDQKVSGLTSAAGLWVSAGVGMACGFGYGLVALMATLLTLLIFTILWWVERGLKNIAYKRDGEEGME